MVTWFKNDKGYTVIGLVKEFDGTTAKSLAGLTPSLKFKDRDGTATSITCTITNDSTGTFTATIPASTFTAVNRYKLQLKLTDGVNYTEHSLPIFIDIDDIAE